MLSEISAILIEIDILVEIYDIWKKVYDILKEVHCGDSFRIEVLWGNLSSSNGMPELENHWFLQRTLYKYSISLSLAHEESRLLSISYQKPPWLTRGPMWL